MKKYSEQIYKLRKFAGLSQEEFADKIGVSRQMISKWELGESSPRMEKLNKICEEFNISLEDLNDKNKENKEDYKISKKIFQNKKAQIIEKRKLFKKVVTRILVISLSIVLLIYIGYSLYKFLYLKSLYREMLKFKEQNNYYFQEVSYKGNEVVQRQKVWYLDGKYKIEDTYTRHDENLNETTSILYIDTKNWNEKVYSKTDDQIIFQKSKTIENEADKNTYKNGCMLYNKFPNLLRNKDNEIIKACLKPKRLITVKDNENIIIKINGMEITIDRKRNIPKAETIYSRKKENDSKIRFLDAEFNCVSIDDIQLQDN